MSKMKAAVLIIAIVIVWTAPSIAHEPDVSMCAELESHMKERAEKWNKSAADYSAWLVDRMTYPIHNVGSVVLGKDDAIILSGGWDTVVDRQAKWLIAHQNYDNCIRDALSKFKSGE